MLRLFAILTVGFLATVSCTRAGLDPKVSLKIGVNGGQGGLAADDILNIVILNVKVPGKSPIVRQVEYHNDDNPIVMGQPIDVTFTDIPNGSGFIIQVLAVYESKANGAMKFLYGDANASVKGDTTINITADNVGTSNTMVRVAGRMITTESPDGGPTGLMTAQFLPPNGKEPMNVETKFIVNGWFQAFAIDSATSGFRYVMSDGTVIFNNFGANATFLTPSTRLLKVIKPVSARRENRGSESSVRVSPETHMYLGFFGLSGISRYACYINTSEAVPNTFTSAALTTPLKFNGAGSGGLVTEMRIAGGGVSETFGAFAGTGASCGAANVDGGLGLLLQHHKSNDEEEFAGFSVPYRSLRPLNQRRSYLAGELDVSTPADPKWNLNWRYLPGAATALAGTEIWYKVYSNSSNESKDQKTCDNMPGGGYSLAGATATPTETFIFSGHGMVYDSVNPQNSNYSNYQFAACAYRLVGSTKQYLGRPAMADCLAGTCGELDHFGWGISDYAPGGAVNFVSNMGGTSQRVTAVTVTADSAQLSINSSAGITVGKEVLLLVSGASGTGPSTDCGTYNGNPIRVGEYAFSRILTTGATIKIGRGTFLDSISPTYLAAAADSANFCYVQAVVVPHYHDLNFTGSQLTTNAFDYSTDGGGVIALRVNGTLNLGLSGDSISVDGRGYPGGVNTKPHGAGPLSAAAATYVNGNMGGQNGTGASGGGGYGSGGDANGTLGSPGMNAYGSGAMSSYVMPRMIFGGGGSGVGPGGDANGGGLVFIMANRITSYSAAIYANGTSGASYYSGGGAGSINVITGELSGMGSGGINFLASGGAGTSDTGAHGGGGGGYVSVTACQNDITGSTNFSVVGGVGNGTPSGSNGSPGLAGYSLTTNFWLCH